MESGRQLADYLVVIGLVLVLVGLTTIVVFPRDYPSPTNPGASLIVHSLGQAAVTIGVLGLSWNLLVTRRESARADSRFSVLRNQLDELTRRVAMGGLSEALQRWGNQWIAEVESSRLKRHLDAHMLRPKVMDGKCYISMKQAKHGQLYREFVIEDQWAVNNETGRDIHLFEGSKWIVLSEFEFSTKWKEFAYDPTVRPYAVTFPTGTEPLHGKTRFLLGPKGLPETKEEQAKELENKPKISVVVQGQKPMLVELDEVDQEALRSSRYHQEYRAKSYSVLKPGETATIRFEAILLLPAVEDGYFPYTFLDYAQKYLVVFKTEESDFDVAGTPWYANPESTTLPSKGRGGDECPVPINQPVTPIDYIKFEWHHVESAALEPSPKATSAKTTKLHPNSSQRIFNGGLRFGTAVGTILTHETNE